MNEAQKLNIRINFVAQADRTVQEESTYIYHWPRIIGTALLLSIAVAALIGGGLSYFHQQQIENNATETAADKQLALVPPASAPQHKEQTMATQRSAIKMATSPAAVKDSAMPTHSSSEQFISADSTAENSIAVTAEKEIPPAGQTDGTAATLFTQAKVEIFSDHIKNFVLAKTVKEREPVGTVNDIVFDVNNIATVYAYSTAVGLQGETLYYKWTLGGQEIAQIKVAVGSNHWRSYSRKFIQPHLHGEWQVALKNSKGETLAVNRFNY